VVDRDERDVSLAPTRTASSPPPATPHPRPSRPSRYRPLPRDPQYPPAPPTPQPPQLTPHQRPGRPHLASTDGYEVELIPVPGQSRRPVPILACTVGEQSLASGHGATRYLAAISRPQGYERRLRPCGFFRLDAELLPDDVYTLSTSVTPARSPKSSSAAKGSAATLAASWARCCTKPPMPWPPSAASKDTSRQGRFHSGCRAPGNQPGHLHLIQPQPHGCTGGGRQLLQHTGALAGHGGRNDPTTTTATSRPSPKNSAWSPATTTHGWSHHCSRPQRRMAGQASASRASTPRRCGQPDTDRDISPGDRPVRVMISIIPGDTLILQ